MIALWKMVGRHVNFGGQLGRFELFDQPGGGVRALKDEPGFELDINPPLPPAHPYHTHTINDNPPVRSTISWQGGSWTTDAAVLTHASASAFFMATILASPISNEGWTPWVAVDLYAGHTRHRGRHTSIHQGLFPLLCVGLFRHDHGGVLDGLLNHSPHQPPDRCTAVVARRRDDSDPPDEIRHLLLTPFDGLFVACVGLATRVDTTTGRERVRDPL